jgi:hypothetical protein
VKTTVGWIGGRGGCEALEVVEVAGAEDSESELAMDPDVGR